MPGDSPRNEVFLANDTSLHRKVALKFLPMGMQQDEIACKRFIREACSAAALDHPFICHINEVGESEGGTFIAMEYVDGQSLKERLESGPVPLKEALQAAVEVTEGLRSMLAGRMRIPTQTVKLAVLPFANLTGDPEQEYLSDGLTQEMIAQLGRLHPQSLSVIARTSVMRHKKTDKPIDQIGKELGLGYILEGSARRDAGRTRILAELIKVQDQTQMWADSFEREMASILALQSDVARKVAESLALKLLPVEQARSANVRAIMRARSAPTSGSSIKGWVNGPDFDRREVHRGLDQDRVGYLLPPLRLECMAPLMKSLLLHLF